MFLILLSRRLHLLILSVNKMVYFAVYWGICQPPVMETAQSKVARVFRTLSGSTPCVNTRGCSLLSAASQSPYPCRLWCSQLSHCDGSVRCLRSACCVSLTDRPAFCTRINRKTVINFLLFWTILAASVPKDVLVCVSARCVHIRFLRMRITLACLLCACAVLSRFGPIHILGK